MTNKPVVYVHIEHKLYQANEVKTCSNCGSQVKTISSEEVIEQDSPKAAMSSCDYCGSDVVIFERVKPEWVELATCGKKAQSIQTCSDRWCKREFLIQLEKDHIQFDRAEEWHVPITCPHCLSEHWINLHRLHEN